VIEASPDGWSYPVNLNQIPRVRPERVRRVRAALVSDPLTALRPAGVLPADRKRGVSYFFAARARLAADLPACFAARPVDSPAERRPPAAVATARFADPSALPAARPCRVPAAFVPAA
jgi:hypothetical protein